MGLPESYTQPAALLESALWDEAVLCGSGDLESSVEDWDKLCQHRMESVFSKKNMHLGSPDRPAIEQAVLCGH